MTGVTRDYARSTTKQHPVWIKALGAFALLLTVYGFYLAIWGSPADINQEQIIRIMYAHVAVAWVSFLAVILTAVFGCLFLWNSHPRWDNWAVANAELTLVYAGLTLVGGMTYSKPTLNTFWTWDAKLTLTALMFALIVGYFIVRGLIDDPQRRGRVSAVVSLIILASLPFNYLAAEWFRTLHPAKSIALDGSGITMDSSMLRVLLINAIAAAFVYLYFMFKRVHIGRLALERDNLPQNQTPEEIHV